jgi:hypothetical protein
MAAAAQTWEQNYTGSNRWCLRLLPSLTDFAFFLPLFLLFAMLSGASRLLSDGDTGWHIRTGEWILQHNAVPKEDLFSFTKPHQAWFAWEWGWDVIFATVHGVWGLAGVAFVNVLLLGVISALLFRLIRRCCDNDILSLAFTLVAVCCSMIHWLARPHLVSWLFVLIFSHAIVSAEVGKYKALCWLPALMLLWVNLHGGFFVGIVLLLTSALGEAAGAALRSENGWRLAYTRSRPYLVAALACLAVTFVNPYTWHLHEHVFAYLGNSKLLDNVQEFQSANFHNPASIFFESMLLLGAGAALWCLRRGKIAAGLSVLLWLHLSLVSQRNIPLYVLIAAPWIACLSLDALRQLRTIPSLARLDAAVSEICTELRPLERIERYHPASILAIFFVACSFAANRPGFEAKFNPKAFPVQAIPVIEAAKFSHLFTSDQWGDYLIYRFYPHQRVFMDGRSDFYGAEFLNNYQHVMSAQYDWEAYLNRFAIDGVMVKPNTPIAAVLKESRQWKMLFDDGSVIVFRADSAGQGCSNTAQRADFARQPRGNRLGTLTSSRVNDSNSSFNFDERRG